MTTNFVTSKVTRREVSTIVLGNAPRVDDEIRFLEAASQMPQSRLYTANMAFLSDASELPWQQKVAVLQDYVYQAIKDAEDTSQFRTRIFVQPSKVGDTMSPERSR